VEILDKFGIGVGILIILVVWFWQVYKRSRQKLEEEYEKEIQRLVEEIKEKRKVIEKLMGMLYDYRVNARTLGQDGQDKG